MVGSLELNKVTYFRDTGCLKVVSLLNIRLLIASYLLGTSDPNHQVMSQETISHNKAAINRIKKSPKASIAKRIGEAATWTWDFIKTPFT